MICYKDRTWCSSPNCKNACGRQFTDKDRQEAIKWWGGEDFPIAMKSFCGHNTDPMYNALFKDEAGE